MSPAIQNRAAAGAAGAGLSKEQKAKVCRMAQEAWRRLGEPMFADQEADGVPDFLRMSRSLAFETWRQLEQERVTGKQSLRAMGQGEFCLLMAHFAQIAEDFDAARYWGERAANDGKRRALWHLEKELERAAPALGHAQRYAAAVAEDKFGTSRLSELSEKQVWELVFTIRRAAARKRRGRR